MDLSPFCLEAFTQRFYLFLPDKSGNRHSGGSDEDRTRYLLHAMEALSQVSYGPTVRY